MKNPFRKRKLEDYKETPEDYAAFLSDSSYLYAIDTWVPLFESGTANVFDVQIVPVANLRITMDADNYSKAYGTNGEFIITARDNSKQVVIDYATQLATIFTGGIIYLIGEEEVHAKQNHNDYG